MRYTASDLYKNLIAFCDCVFPPPVSVAENEIVYCTPLHYKENMEKGNSMLSNSIYGKADIDLVVVVFDKKEKCYVKVLLEFYETRDAYGTGKHNYHTSVILSFRRITKHNFDIIQKLILTYFDYKDFDNGK
jgi:hypothetical protein